MLARRRSRVLLAAAAMTSAFAVLPAWCAPDPAGVATIFHEAQRISDADGGRLWGRKLYGPIIVVDPTDQRAIANEADSGGVLKPSGGAYAGVLPASVTVSNTPIEWLGKRWTELLWPLETKGDTQAAVGDDWKRVLLAHEMFHRIQPALGLTRPEVTNIHLDTLQGRYLLQLEWRALAKALTASTPAERRLAAAQALAFRAERHRLFPEAAKAEASLDIDEGIAEYTGVRLGVDTPQARTRYAIYDLSAFLGSPTFVRAFPDASGPAYGLLLDDADPAWRGKLASGARVDQLLSAALHLSATDVPALKASEAEYDRGGVLYIAEVKRDHERQAQLAALKARLVDGPVLTLPLSNPNYSFNPQTLQPLAGYGTVYPTMHLGDAWGRLQIDHGGALLNPGMSSAAVSAAGFDASTLAGDGWRLTLAPGWSVSPGSRKGDLAVARSANAAH